MRAGHWLVACCCMAPQHERSNPQALPRGGPSHAPTRRVCPLLPLLSLPQGVRFNAEKKQVGQYHSTRIWSFRMRTPCCQHSIEIHTDPKNAEYVIVSGARRCVCGAGFSGVRERDGAKRCTCRRATGLQRQERVAGLGAASSGDGSGRLMCSALYWLCPAHPPDLGALLVLSPGRSVCRKVESFDAEKAGTVELESAEERDKRAADPFAKLEHGGEDKQRALATFTQIAALQEESGAKHRCAASKVVHQSATRPRVCRCCHASEWPACVSRGNGEARQRADGCTACRSFFRGVQSF